MEFDLRSLPMAWIEEKDAQGLVKELQNANASCVLPASDQQLAQLKDTMRALQSKLRFLGAADRTQAEHALSTALGTLQGTAQPEPAVTEEIQ